MAAATVTGRIISTAKVLIGGYDVSGYHNKVTATVSRDMLPADQFGKTGKCRKAGNWDWNVAHSGFWDGGATTIDGVLRGILSSSLMTVCPQAGAAGETSAWFGNIMAPNYETGGTVGGLTTFAGVAQLQDGYPPINGTILQAADITTTGTGTGYEVGAVSATQKVYCGMHVTSSTGAANRTLDVIVQSASEGTFGAPTTRFTFTQATTAVTSEYQTPVAGEITDTFWRISYTRGGTSGTFTVYVVLGIL